MKRKLINSLIISVLMMIALPCMVMAASTTPTVKVSNSLSVPKFTTVTRKGKGKTKIKWTKVANASGYQIQYGQNAAYQGAKSIVITNKNTLAKSISKLPTNKDTWIRIRSYQNISSTKVYSRWSANVRVIVWKKSWTYAKNSKIHSDPAILYYSQASNKKNKTIAVNAGHGCKGGASKKTLCHPNGTAKVTGGSTSAGAKYATAINSGTSVRGMSEAAANLKIANKLKNKLLNAGYNVLMIRQDSNTKLDNIARTVMANNNADCHIAIHFDSTTSNKGAFYISVPNVGSYRNMQPVKANWRKHQALGSGLVSGLRRAGVKIWGKGSLPLDLTQTSYSKIASVDIEVGDQKTSTSDSNLDKIANGLLKGIQTYFR